MFHKFSVSIGILCAASSAYGSPVISAVTRSGTSVTVNGSFFGVKPTAAPLRWETWAGAMEGQTPSQVSNGWWSVSENPSEQPRVTFAAEKTRRPGQPVVDMSQAPDPLNPTKSISKLFYRNQIGFLQSRQIYLNLWVYTNHARDPLNDRIDTQSKFLHISNNLFSSSSSSFPYIQGSFWEEIRPEMNQFRTSMYSNGNVSSDAAQLTANNDVPASAPIIKQEGWQQLQIEINQGAADTANGSMTLRMTGPGYGKYGVRAQSSKLLIGTSPNWNAGTSYTAGKTVWFNGARYSCLSGVTSALSPDLDVAHWKRTVDHEYLDALTFWIWAQKRDSNAWSPTRTYPAGAKADYNGKAYLCTADILSATSPDLDPAHWEKKADTVWPASTTRWYFDSIYVDSSFARVELCDSATWAARAHCEIQPPTSWSEGQISATLNPGTFAAGQTLYLYVVGPEGSVNSDGYRFQSAPKTAAPANLKAL